MLLWVSFFNFTSAQKIGEPILMEHVVWDDGGNEYGYSITQTNDSGYIVVGSGHGDLLVLKFDSQDNVQWSRYINAGSTVEKLLSVTTDDDGYIISVGSKRNLTTGRDDFVMIKMDIWGNIIWENITNDDYPNGAVDVIFDPDDNSYMVVGRWGVSEAAAHIWKFDKNGNLVWDRDVSRGDYGWNTLTSIAVYNSTAYCVYGYGDGPTGTKDVFFEFVSRQDGSVISSYTFGTYADEYPAGIVCDKSGYIYLSISVSSHIEIYKFDAYGNSIWNRTITSSYINKLHVSTNGNYLLLGGYNQFSSGSAEVSLVALSFDNKTLWTHNESVTGKDYIMSIQWFSSTEFYLVGNTTASNDDVLVIHYVLDITPPTVTITSPSDDTYTSKTQIILTWTGEDDFGIDHYEVSDGGNQWINVGLSNSYQFTNLYEGKHRLYVKAVDIGGNKRISYVDVTVDTIPPVVSFANLQDGEYLNTSSFDIYWRVNDASPVDIELHCDNENWVNVSNRSSYPLNLSEGVHTLSLKATDYAGNTNTTSISITIDTVAPALHISPVNEYLNSTQVTISWNGSDNYGIKSYEISVDDRAWKDLGKNSTINLNLDEGKHTIKIKAVDYAGNSNISEITFYIDTHPPWISDFNAVQQGTKIKVSWSGNDNVSGIDYYLIRVDGSSWKKIEGNFTYLNNLAPGKHSITIRAYDKVGNYAEETYTIKVKSRNQIPLLLTVIGIIVALIVIGLLVVWMLRRKKEGEGEQLGKKLSV